MWNDSSPTYDTAEICLNGHLSNSSTKKYPTKSQPHCVECGEKTIRNCQNCDKDIRGRQEYAGLAFSYDVPSYCIYCGNPFPWIQARVEAAIELADLIDEFTDEDKEIITKSIPDLVRDTPRRQIAILQFKNVMKKTSSNIVMGFKEILFDILSEPINESLWG